MRIDRRVLPESALACYHGLPDAGGDVRTYEDIRAKCEAWREEHPSTRLRVPEPGAIESCRSEFGDEVLDRLRTSIDDQIRREQRARERAAGEDA